MATYEIVNEADELRPAVWIETNTDRCFPGSFATSSAVHVNDVASEVRETAVSQSLLF